MLEADKSKASNIGDDDGSTETSDINPGISPQVATTDASSSSRETLIFQTTCFSSGSASGMPSPEPMNAWAVRRQFFFPVIAPGLFMGKANQIVTPFIPILVRADLHGSIGDVSLVSMAGSAGQLLCAVPVGILIEKLRHEVGSCSALCILLLISLLCFTAWSVPVLAVFRFLNGAAMCAWDISQKTLLSTEVPKEVRGRISATLAGSNRLAAVVAALLGGVCAQFLATRSVFLLRAALLLFSFLMLLIHVRLQRTRGTRNYSVHNSVPRNIEERNGHSAQEPVSTWIVLRKTWPDLFGAGIFCALLNGVRSTYLILLPLKGHDIGLMKLEIGCLVAAMRAADALMALTSSGQVMDKYGQKASGLPSTLIMGLAYCLTPMCNNLVLLVITALLYAVGNGLSAGIVVSFQIGLAPDYARSQFLGLWKLVTASGGFIIPGLFGAVADRSGSLETAAMTISSTCIFSALWLLFVARVPSRSSTRLGRPSGQSVPLNS